MNSFINKTWYRLDNAAKVFPATSGRSDTKVFRISAELYENVNETILQAALDKTTTEFTSFNYILKNGLFWYYLEKSDLRALVSKESASPCSTNYLSGRQLLFDVTYFEKRINLEVYHAMSDGTGALQFLRFLVLNYLKLAHDTVTSDISQIDLGASYHQEMSDSFTKHYDPVKGHRKVVNRPAYKIKGAKDFDRRLSVIGGTASVAKLLAKSREYNTTITILLTALLIKAIYSDMSAKQRKKPIVIGIPVNLRNYFESKAMRNFFAFSEIGCDLHLRELTTEDIIEQVKLSSREQISKESMQGKLNKMISIERNILLRILPLPIKNIAVNVLWHLISRGFTAMVSNIGKIDLPADIAPFIKKFDAFFYMTKPMIGVVSFEDCINITFASPLLSTNIQCAFFRELTSMGIDVEISANNLRA